MSYQFPAAGAVVLNPGDSVLIGLAPTAKLPPERLGQMLDDLRDRFAGVSFTFVADVTGLLIRHPE